MIVTGTEFCAYQALDLLKVYLAIQTFPVANLFMFWEYEDVTGLCFILVVGNPRLCPPLRVDLIQTGFCVFCTMDLDSPPQAASRRLDGSNRCANGGALFPSFSIRLSSAALHGLTSGWL
jgi:hypothetical protein